MGMDNVSWTRQACAPLPEMMMSIDTLWHPPTASRFARLAFSELLDPHQPGQPAPRLLVLWGGTVRGLGNNGARAGASKPWLHINGSAFWW